MDEGRLTPMEVIRARQRGLGVATDHQITSRLQRYTGKVAPAIAGRLCGLAFFRQT